MKPLQILIVVTEAFLLGLIIGSLLTVSLKLLGV